MVNPAGVVMVWSTGQVEQRPTGLLPQEPPLGKEAKP
jgi:hypothetical protein